MHYLLICTIVPRANREGVAGGGCKDMPYCRCAMLFLVGYSLSLHPVLCPVSRFSALCAKLYALLTTTKQLILLHDCRPCALVPVILDSQMGCLRFPQSGLGNACRGRVV
jgi:hypothetical protein